MCTNAFWSTLQLAQRVLFYSTYIFLCVCVCVRVRVCVCHVFQWALWHSNVSDELRHSPAPKPSNSQAHKGIWGHTIKTNELSCEFLMANDTLDWLEKSAFGKSLRFPTVAFHLERRHGGSKSKQMQNLFLQCGYLYTYYWILYVSQNWFFLVTHTHTHTHTKLS